MVCYLDKGGGNSLPDYKLKLEIENERNRLQDIIRRVGAIISVSPEGYLQHHQKGSGRKYFERCIKQDRGRDVKYLSLDSEELDAYIKKYCAVKVKRAAEKALIQLIKDPAKYDYDSIELVYQSLDELFGDLLPKRFWPRNRILKDWQESFYESNGMTIPEGKGILTETGILVRSKNEALAAGILEKLHIPFHYEEMLKLKNGKKLCPDFTICSPVNGKKYYIEIFGMMSDPEYLSGTAKKIDIYLQNNILINERLLVFFCLDDQRLDMKQFEAIVKNAIYHEWK